MDVVSLDEAVVRCSVNKRRNLPVSAFWRRQSKCRAELQIKRKFDLDFAKAASGAERPFSTPVAVN